MKYIKTYEELKYSQDDIKLIRKLRYNLNKVFGKNCCGVSKVRSIKGPITYNRYTSNEEWVEYTGTTMLFDIFLPRTTDDRTLEIFKKYAVKSGLEKQYDFDDNSYIGTYEQMTEFLKYLPYIKMEADMVKYNI